MSTRRQPGPHYKWALKRIDELIGSGGRALFDVGAGAGEFLVLARQRGFEPYGNEFAPGAIEMAKERRHRSPCRRPCDDRGDEPVRLGHDVVRPRARSEPDELLRNVLRVLKPGGILFLQTPRWSAMDIAALRRPRIRRTGRRCWTDGSATCT